MVVHGVALVLQSVYDFIGKCEYLSWQYVLITLGFNLSCLVSAVVVSLVQSPHTASSYRHSLLIQPQPQTQTQTQAHNEYVAFYVCVHCALE